MTRQVSKSSLHVKELAEAKKFVRKYFKVTGSGVSFNREDGVFSSSCTIETKYGMEREVEWWKTPQNFYFHLSLESSVEVDEFSHIVNCLDETLLKALIRGIGVGDYHDGLSYVHKSSFLEEDFQRILSNLHIDESEFVCILCDLYFKKIHGMIERSLSVTQRAYDKWVESGCVETVRKERISSTFGDAFVKALTDSVLSFHDVFVKQKSEQEIFSMRQTNERAHREIYKESTMKEAAIKWAETSWKLWSQNEVRGILDILLRYDVGRCLSFELRYDDGKMVVEGDIHGDTGKRLNFHTIFAGGYNIQRLHTRTIAHVFDN